MKTHTSTAPASTVFFMAIILSIALLGLNGCGSSYPAPGVDGKKYQYVYQLIEPEPSPKMEFKNSKFSISFSIDDAAVSFIILNLTPDLMRVESGGAMIGIDGQFSPARNRQSFYTNVAEGFAPMIVPPRGYLEDIIIPHSNIYWDDDEGAWMEKDLFSTLDSGTVSGRRNIAQNIGKKLDIVLPISLGESKMDYQFSFIVQAIKIVSPNAPMIAKQRPPAPKD